ncbi:sperm motility kinase-like, partial [Nannospalax galili]|uniref:sperm motility kinase-like n=1 Tax=Nannospalax galili TaxID=1026970 RepID=UPI00081A066F
MQILKHTTSRSEEATMEPRLNTSSSEEDIFTDHYLILKTLGQGSFAGVKLALHRHTAVPVAVKILEKDENNASEVMSEVGIINALDHPNIIKLFHVIETRRQIYMVMEHADWGDLTDYLEKVGCPLQEEEARPIFTQMACAVNYCHENAIAHSDIKLDNLLLDDRGHIKLCDFGLAIKVTAGQKFKGCYGTPAYCAPELFTAQEYDVLASDIWSMGVVLYVLLTYTFPFEADTFSQLKRKILNPKLSIPCKLSPHIINLIRQLFTVNFRQRPTIHDIMGHQWLKDSEELSKLPSSLEMSPSIPNRSIVLTMCDMGYNPKDIRDSLHEKKFDNIMATYLILKHKSPQGYNTNCQNKPMQPAATRTPAGPVTFTRHRRTTLLVKRQLYDDNEGSRKGIRSHSMPAILCCQQKGMDSSSSESSLEGSAESVGSVGGREADTVACESTLPRRKRRK